MNERAKYIVFFGIPFRIFLFRDNICDIMKKI